MPVGNATGRLQLETVEPIDNHRIVDDSADFGDDTDNDLNLDGNNVFDKAIDSIKNAKETFDAISGSFF